MKVFLPFSLTSSVTASRLLKCLIVSTMLLPALSAAQSMAEFEQWKRQYMGEFKQYKDEMDREFADFLNQQWKPFDTEKGVIRDEAPKPPRIPVVRIDDKKPPVVVKPAKPEPRVAEIPLPRIIPEPVIIIPPEPPVLTQKGVNIEFLGHQLSIVDGISSSVSMSGLIVSQSGIQLKFSQLAQSDYPQTLQQLTKLKRQLNLNDWAYVRLVQQFTKQLTASDNMGSVVSWFLLLKSDLDARIAYDSSRIYLLVPASQNLYDIAYFKFGAQKYYSVSRQKKLPPNLYSYDGNYPKSLKLSDFALTQPLSSKPDTQTKHLSFSYQQKKYELNVPFNRYTVDFLSSYPQMDINEYFQSPLNSSTATALLSQLRPMVNDMSETEAVNLLLRFVQKAFRYATDQDQFGEENYMFAEETIFYPASDCEDRAVFFAWLVKNLLGLNVVGLDFPGHVATAVELKNPLGDVISYQHKQYTIADPTYINASAGMKMPQFKNVTPKVISNL
ncbi:MAG: hypothetical protein H8E21_11370 [Gammaproteobacteria bacterium]|nr:hypothetical protein [Gammaproteobacteria bacterium]